MAGRGVESEASSEPDEEEALDEEEAADEEQSPDDEQSWTKATHQRSADGEKKQCRYPGCGKWVTASGISSHESSHKGKVTCKHCKKDFARTSLKAHELTCDKNPNRGPEKTKVTCEHCKKDFARTSLKRHELICDKNPNRDPEKTKAKCQYCGNTLRKDGLKRHELTCDKNPNRAPNRDPEKTKCQHCGASFHKSGVAGHELYCDKNPNRDPQSKCQHCGGSFHRLRLARHELHCDKNPKVKALKADEVSCDRCGEHLPRSAYEFHKWFYCTHRHDFICTLSECGLHFRTREALDAHRDTAHPDVPYTPAPFTNRQSSPSRASPASIEPAEWSVPPDPQLLEPPLSPRAACRSADRAREEQRVLEESPSRRRTAGQRSTSEPQAQPQTQDRLIFHRTYDEIVDLAARSWRSAHPEETSRGPSRQTNRNYWSMKSAELHKEVWERVDKELARTSIGGMNKTNFLQGRLNRESRIIHQTIDALDGIMPTPDPNLHTTYHGLRKEKLLELARQRKIVNSALKTKEQLITELETLDPTSGHIQPMSEEDARAIATSLVNDLNAALPSLLPPGVPSDEAQEREPQQEREQQIIQLEDQLVQTATGTLAGLSRDIARLQDAVNEELFPAPTSASGLLCGPRAIETALHAARRIQYRRDRESHRPPTLITADYMMRLLFENWTVEAASDRVPGRPMRRYREWIQQNVDAAVIPMLPELYAMHNIGIYHFRAIVAILFDQGELEAQYDIGVVHAAHVAWRTREHGRAPEPEAQRAVVTIHPYLRNTEPAEDPETPTVWLHNNAPLGNHPSLLGERYGHWEGFGEGGDRYHALAWGLPTRDSSSMPHFPLGKRYPGPRRGGRQRGVEPAVVPEPIQRGDERPPKPRPQLYLGTEVTQEIVKPWMAFPEDYDEIEAMRSKMQQDPEREDEHFLLIICQRLSSHPGPHGFQQVVNSAAGIQLRYNQFLNDPNMTAANGIPSGDTPLNPNTGAPLPVRVHSLVFARQGTRPIPSRLGNLADPFLRNFVTLVHQVTAAGNPYIPEEWHFLLNGFAGFSVGISGWGSRNEGFFKFILDRDQANMTNIASHIFLIVIVEHHVANGTQTWSLPNAQQDFTSFQHKHITSHKYRLMDLIDRQEEREHHAVRLSLGLVTGPIPQTAVQARLDRFIDWMQDEYRWRASHLDGTTQPTDADVSNRNNGRNASW